MLRRDFNIALGSIALGSLTLKAYAGSTPKPPRGPLFWLVTRGQARVFLLGFGDAKDQSWFTPPIQRAFQESSQLLLEVGPTPGSDNRDAAAKQADADETKALEHETGGRTFFDALQPEARVRTLAAMERLGVTKESVETLRPWKAYYTINSAFWKDAKFGHQQFFVDSMLCEKAIAQGKTIAYEMPTRLDFVRFMANMSDAAQSEYIEWLLDFIEDQNAGRNSNAFEWLVGNPTVNTRNLDRMRSKYPDLYQFMQPLRNGWWAQKIDQLLTAGGTYFIAIGELHVLGPDGIPQQLLRRGIVKPSQLLENPSMKSVG